MRFRKTSINKSVCAVLAVIMVISVFAMPASANDQNTAQITVTSSETNPAKGEIITVTVAITNYKTMSPLIAAMYLSVSYDPAYFDYVANSEKATLKINTGDLTSIHYNGADTVSFAYTYANTRKNLLPRTATEIFTFQLRVKTTITAKAETEFTVNDLSLYNGKTEETYSEIACKTPITDTVTVWVERPAILFNGISTNRKTYKENVVLTFDASSASLVYEGRAAISITSPYTCDKNGDYTVSVTKNGVKTTEAFVIGKDIDNISVKVGTFKTEYALGVTPDYDGGVLIVTYKDGTYAQLSMGDPDITITGFDPTATGEQRLLIKYKDKTASAIIKVTTKNVISFTIISPISKTEYLVGQQIDVTGGKLFASYDDGSSEEVSLSIGMLSGFDITYVGTQEITVTYGTAKQTFSVTYYSRETVDALLLDIDALDLLSITTDSKDALLALKTRYESMTTLQKQAVTNITKLNDALALYNSLVVNSTQTDPATTKPVSGDSTTGAAEPGGGDNLKMVWYIVGIIVLVSILAGVIYFLVVYYKKKKDLDDEYYDDDDDEPDEDDDLTFDDDDLIDGEGEDDDDDK